MIAINFVRAQVNHILSWSCVHQWLLEQVSLKTVNNSNLCTIYLVIAIFIDSCEHNSVSCTELLWLLRVWLVNFLKRKLVSVLTSVLVTRKLKLKLVTWISGSVLGVFSSFEIRLSDMSVNGAKFSDKKAQFTINYYCIFICDLYYAFAVNKS